MGRTESTGETLDGDPRGQVKQVIHLPFDVALQPGHQIPLDCTTLLASTRLHITFEGHPWDDDYYEWDGGPLRTDALFLAWTKCKIETYRKYGQLSSEPTGICVQVDTDGPRKV